MIGPGALVAAALLLADAAGAAKIEVVNADAYFPEGPLWHEGQLYYTEYAADTVMTWDGKENREVWRQDGCGPSAVIEAGDGHHVSEMAARRVLKFEVEEDGALGEREVFARLPDLAADPEGVDLYAGPGGLITDHQGNLYIAHFEGGRVLVVDRGAI